MSNHYPSRRRAQPRSDDDFLAYESNQPYQHLETQNAYDPYDPYQQYPPRNSFPAEPQSPPRRHKSERHRGAPSPYYHSDEPDEPSRRHGQRHSRHDEDRRGRSAGPDRRGRGPSPLPDPDPPRRYPRSSRRERDVRPERDRDVRPERDLRHERNLRNERDPRPERNIRPEREPRFIDPYDDPGLYSRDPPPRKYPSSRDRPRPSRTSARASPPEPRARGRSSRHPENDDGEFNTTRRRRPRSQTRGNHDRAPSGPSPTRGRPPPTQRGRDAPARRSSMPASTKARSQWWQNPLLQAGARTALTAGAQAAMKSRNDQGAWMGAKGAKVATAALGAALVDGFIGQKHPNSARQNIAKEGVDFATGKVGSSASRHHRR